MSGANEDLRAYLRQGRLVMHRTTDYLRRHMHSVLNGCTIYIAPRGEVYHQDPGCFHLRNSEPRLYDPRDYCMTRELMPHIGAPEGTTLQEDIDSWVADVDEVVN